MVCRAAFKAFCITKMYFIRVDNLLLEFTEIFLNINEST
jgi:hypothetical protein